jgi:hypothetical protein
MGLAVSKIQGDASLALVARELWAQGVEPKKKTADMMSTEMSRVKKVQLTV